MYFFTKEASYHKNNETCLKIFKVSTYSENLSELLQVRWSYSKKKLF